MSHDPAPEERSPRFVTDEPGLDPVSGRPWGEETPEKRAAAGVLLVIVGLGVTAAMILSRPDPEGLRTVLAYAAGPVLALFGLVRLHAERRHHDRSGRGS